MGERDTVRYTELKPRDGTAPSEGGKANGNTYAAPGSAAGSEVHLKCLYISLRSRRNKIRTLSFIPFP